jgi:hypothetical protein
MLRRRQTARLRQGKATSVSQVSRRVEQYFVRINLLRKKDLDKVGGMARHLPFEAQLGETTP